MFKIYMKKNKNIKTKIIKTDFILASASPRRQKLLKEQGYKFRVVVPNTKELEHHHLSCKHAALENALAKALSVAQKNKNKVVVSADTIVVLKGKILGKPKTKKQALNMLLSLNNKTHEVITAYVVLKVLDQKDDQRIKIIEQKAVTSKVSFGNFKPEEYLNYVNSGEPNDKAGAYGIQGLGARFIKDFKGSYTNIVGLPVFEIMHALKKAGLEYPWKSMEK